ncbi:BNR-4 repeat-containing protein [Actinoplanes sp. NPDC051411]|uniref:BNR-4 repeat-containing protein n=1 Tax=Actinoplanes sp. NPDC051411 TaxID=3155522 RepID=UPI00342FBFDC
MRTQAMAASFAALVAAAGAAPPPASAPVMTPATAVAARTDRRPVAGGLYDAAAGKTFISWGGQYEDNYVQAYDHRSRTWSAPVLVAGGDNDSHNYPTMVQAADGHLLVFRGLHNKELWVARSPKPHSIEGTWTDVQIPAGLGATYPMPVRTADGTLFVFIRETAGDFDPGYPTDTRPMKYVRSTDNGLTWQSSASLTGDRWAIAPLGRADNMNEVYVGQLRYEPATLLHGERIGIVYTLAGGGPEGHLHDRYHRNIYYATFTPADLHFHAADGHDLGTTVDDADQEAHLKVVDTPLQTVNPRSPDYISLVGSTLGAWPFVVWMRLDADGRVHDEAALWSPLGGWRNREVTTGVRVRDMERLDATTWRVYGTDDAGTPGITTYRLTGGTRWRFESAIATPRAVQRIEVIADHRDPARILATGASSDRDVAVADGDVYVAGAPGR